MLPDTDFPPLTSTWMVLIIFVVALTLFHLIFVVWLRLGKLAWKIVDYIWLGFVSLGLVGAAAQARQVVASNLVAIAEERVHVAYTPFRSLVDSYSREGAVCRTFVRGPYSPPPDEFDRTQRDFDTVCRWFREVSAKVPQSADSSTAETSLGSLPPDPDVREGELKDILRGFHSQLEYYNLAVRRNSEILQASKRSATEESLILSSPLLLSLALALRITKVTGEIVLG